MKEDKNPKIIIHENMATELIFAAATAAEYLNGKKQSAATDFSAPAYLTGWLEKIAQEISPFERADISVVFSTVSARLFLFYELIHHDISTIEALQQHLEHLDTEQFLAGSRELLHIPGDEQQWRTPSRIQEALEVDRMDIYADLAKEARQLSYILNEPGQFLARIRSVLSWFSQRYVTPYAGEIASSRRSFLETNEQKIDQQPVFVLDQLSSGNYDIISEHSEIFHFFPIHFIADDISILMPDQIHVIFGTAHLGRLLAKDQRDYTDELLKALNDPRRLAILRLLKRRSWFSKELADELKLTPATVSYHMDMLFKAELIRIEHTGGRRYYYTLNAKGMKKLIEGLRQEFLEDPGM